jgi:hypothetical protein
VLGKSYKIPNDDEVSEIRMPELPSDNIEGELGLSQLVADNNSSNSYGLYSKPAKTTTHKNAIKGFF